MFLVIGPSLGAEKQGEFREALFLFCCSCKNSMGNTRGVVCAVLGLAGLNLDALSLSLFSHSLSLSFFGSLKTYAEGAGLPAGNYRRVYVRSIWHTYHHRRTQKKL